MRMDQGVHEIWKTKCEGVDWIQMVLGSLMNAVMEILSPQKAMNLLTI